MALLTSIKNKEYRTSSKHFKKVDVLLLYDIIRLDGVIKLDEDEMTFELKDDQLIIHIQKLFPTLKIVGINLDAYEKYHFPKNIKLVPNKIQNLINVAFYNDIGKKPADKIDGYTFIYDGNPDDSLLVRFGTIPGSNIYTNCKFDIKGRFGFLFVTLPEDRNKERPFLISTSNMFRPEETYLNTDYINLSKMVFNGTNKFEKTYDNKLYMYFYRIHLDTFYARNVGGIDGTTANNIREFINAQLNPNKKYTKMMIIPTALDWSDTK